MLSKKSKNKIWESIKKNPLENTNSIKNIEKFFLKERGYIFKMPQPGESVILLLSGGADSIVLWDILISKFKLNVYPLFVTNKKGFIKYIDHQYRSIKYFEKYYQNKNPNLFHPNFTISIGSSLREEILLATLKNPLEILNNLYEKGSINVNIYSTTNLQASASLDYVQLLKIQENIKIKAIFTGILSTDGLMAQNQTVTSLRSIMFNLCNISNDYSQQFTSLFLEKELGYFFSKNFIAKWAKKHNIPLNKTWTCWKKEGLIPCGTCVACTQRKEIMRTNKVSDTLYITDIRKWFLTTLNKVDKLKNKIKSLGKGKNEKIFKTRS